MHKNTPVLSIRNTKLFLAILGVGFAILYANCNPLSAQQKGKKGKASVEKVQATKEAAPAVGKKLDHQSLAKFIDEKVNARLQLNEVAGSPRCDDGEFIRRAYLDIVGVIPPAEKVAEFLDSKDSNKRAKLIDELLDNPRYGKYFAEIWANAIIPSDSTIRRLDSTNLEAWLSERFNSNTAWDKIVRDIVNAEGALNEKNGATTFFVANPTPDKVTDKVTQLFLGVQLQCAQCHNHPFTDVKQTEYWGMAAFFMNVRIAGNPNQAAKNGTPLVVSENGKGRAKLPVDAKVVPAKFLSGSEPKLAKNEPYRPILADWMTTKENRYFSRAIVNKMWYHFYGRGIVNPADDMHDDNPASHPELLAGLAEQMKANDFDLKYLIRAICNSETYQRTGRPTGNNADDRELFSHALVRNMTPEQLYDSLESILKVNAGKEPVRGKGKKAPVRGNNNNPRAQFVASFGLDVGFNPLEYQAGIPQALRLMNSAQLSNANGLVAQAMKAKEPAQVIEHLYLATVSRRPTAEETTLMTKYVSQQSDPRTAYSDITWALLNSSEFALNH